jgi:myo-inositol 2-dehydrogenase / D-chiro-inositol 1-dehydrogenase
MTQRKKSATHEATAIRAGHLSGLPHPPDRRVRTGIIGCGARGRHLAITSTIRRPLEITHLYDVSEAALEEMRNAVKWDRPPAVCGSAAELCEREDLDAVIITTPAHLHMEALRAAVENGKHILLDKPISATVADASAMVELVKGYAPVCYVGMQYREMPVARKLREILDAGRLGDVKMVHIEEQRQPYFAKWQEWNKFRELSGGTMVEKCCHFFDLFHYFTGSRPAKVYCSGGRDVAYDDFELDGRPADIIDNSFTIVEMENGMRCCLHLCMFDRQPYEGQKITLNGSGGSAYAEAGKYFVHVGSNTPDADPEDIRLRVDAAIANSGHNGGDYHELERFRHAVLGGPRDLPSMEDGYWAIVAGAAAEESIRTGRPVLVSEFAG